MYSHIYKHTEILTCPSISPPTNGAITFTPGTDNSNIGLGSVATYSCNLGYVLVGHTTRACQSLYGGASAAWSLNPPVCQGKYIITASIIIIAVIIDLYSYQ